jgi:hypothetical protein
MTTTMMPDNPMLLVLYALPFLAVFGIYLLIGKPRDRHHIVLACAAVAALSPSLNVNVYRANWISNGTPFLLLALLGCIVCALPKKEEVPGGLRLRLGGLCAALVYTWWTFYMYILSACD